MPKKKIAMPSVDQSRPLTGEFAVIDLRASEAPGLILIDKLMLIEQLIALDPDARIVMLTAQSGIVEAAQGIGKRIERYLLDPEYAATLGLIDDPGQGQKQSISTSTERSIDQVEWEHIQRVLALHKGNKTAAARTLKINLSTLKRKLSRSGPIA
jgi:two-component system response regulator RegA